MRWTFADALTVARRNLSHLLRVPEKLLGFTLMPIVFVLLFGYVFGSAISVPGGNYRAYLMPGIFTMTLAGTLAGTAVGVAEDMAKGVIDRFRTLPMARSAVLLGGTLASLVESALGLVVLALCGLVAGWRTHHDVAHTLAAFGLLLLLGFAMNWVGTFLGLIVRSAASADAVAMLFFFPLSFIGNTFVPTQGMLPWLRTFADWNPLSATVAACRSLFGNPGATHATAWPLQHPVVASLGWSVLLLLVFIPLSVRRYRALR
jgi:ABC transporter DrrB family efflux protein